MKISQVRKFLIILILAITLLATPLLTAGCASPVSGTVATDLSETLVPQVNLDVYIYVNQQQPTIIPKSLIGTTDDISVQSLSIWGVVISKTEYELAGALTFTAANDANQVFTRIPSSAKIYLKLSDRTIYFSQSSGGAAENIKNDIDTNNFKRYDDRNVLAEVSKLPSGGNTNPGLICIVKPNPTAVNFVKQFLNQDAANTINNIFNNAKPSIIVLGIFGSQPLNLSDLAQRISNDTVWDIDVGVVASMDSIYPGIIFSPIANNFLSSQGFPKVTIGNLTAYKDSAGIGSGKTIPIYLNVSGNHVYAAASGNDSYAQTLLSKINRN